MAHEGPKGPSRSSGHFGGILMDIRGWSNVYLKLGFCRDDKGKRGGST